MNRIAESVSGLAQLSATTYHDLTGLILFWWYGSRQRDGHAVITISKLPALPVLDPRAFTNEQLDRCQAIFDDLKGHEFLPAHRAHCDQTRKTLDRELLIGITSVLQLDADLEEGLDLLRRQWCAEPSVHGKISTRIGDS